MIPLTPKTITQACATATIARIKIGLEINIAALAIGLIDHDILPIAHLAAKSDIFIIGGLSGSIVRVFGRDLRGRRFHKNDLGSAGHGDRQGERKGERPSFHNQQSPFTASTSDHLSPHQPAITPSFPKPAIAPSPTQQTIAHSTSQINDRHITQCRPSTHKPAIASPKKINQTEIAYSFSDKKYLTDFVTHNDFYKQQLESPHQ